MKNKMCNNCKYLIIEFVLCYDFDKTTIFFWFIRKLFPKKKKTNKCIQKVNWHFFIYTYIKIKKFWIKNKKTIKIYRKASLYITTFNKKKKYIIIYIYVIKMYIFSKYFAYYNYIINCIIKFINKYKIC